VRASPTWLSTQIRRSRPLLCGRWHGATSISHSHPRSIRRLGLLVRVRVAAWRRRRRRRLSGGGVGGMLRLRQSLALLVAVARVTVNKLGDLSSSSCLDSLTPLSVLSQQQRLGEPKLLRVDITHTVHGPAAGQDVHARAQRGHRISYLRWWVQWHGDENEQGGCPLAAAGRTAARPSSPEPPHQHERPTQSTPPAPRARSEQQPPWSRSERPVFTHRCLRCAACPGVYYSVLLPELYLVLHVMNTAWRREWPVPRRAERAGLRL
jgi:hypothetical protein